MCGVKGVPGEEGRVREEEDGEEVITFKRTSTTYPIDVYVRILLSCESSKVGRLLMRYIAILRPFIDSCLL